MNYRPGKKQRQTGEHATSVEKNCKNIYNQEYPERWVGLRVAICNIFVNKHKSNNEKLKHMLIKIPTFKGGVNPETMNQHKSCSAGILVRS